MLRIVRRPQPSSRMAPRINPPADRLPASHPTSNIKHATAKAILAADNAVVVMPRTHLADGTYTAKVSTNAGSVTWKFKVDRNAELAGTPPEAVATPDTVATASPTTFQPVSPFRLVDTREGRGAARLQAGQVARIRVGGSDIAAVSANITVVQPSAGGYITAYNCSSTRPTVSTVNFDAGQTVANQSIVPLAGGDMCVFALVTTDLVVDVNGYYRGTNGSGFVPITPTRLYDSRAAGRTVLHGGTELTIQVAGAGGVPTNATSVALNVTVVRPIWLGFVQVYPCREASSQTISNINYTTGDVRPNAAVVPVDSNGRVCVRSLATTDIVIDVTGYFAAGSGLQFQPLSPIRLFDSRSTFAGLNNTTAGALVAAGQTIRLDIAGRRGVPAGAKAVSVNLTATGAVAGTYLTAFPCGTRPPTSNLNIEAGSPAVANGAMVKLSSDGDLCIFTLNPVHVIIDINGAWS